MRAERNERQAACALARAKGGKFSRVPLTVLSNGMLTSRAGCAMLKAMGGVTERHVAPLMDALKETELFSAVSGQNALFRGTIPNDRRDWTNAIVTGEPKDSSSNGKIEFLIRRVVKVVTGVRDAKVSVSKRYIRDLKSGKVKSVYEFVFLHEDPDGPAQSKTDAEVTLVKEVTNQIRAGLAALREKEGSAERKAQS